MTGRSSRKKQLVFPLQAVGCSRQQGNRSQGDKNGSGSVQGSWEKPPTPHPPHPPTPTGRDRSPLMDRSNYTSSLLIGALKATFPGSSTLQADTNLTLTFPGRRRSAHCLRATDTTNDSPTVCFRHLAPPPHPAPVSVSSSLFCCCCFIAAVTTSVC